MIDPEEYSPTSKSSLRDYLGMAFMSLMDATIQYDRLSSREATTTSTTTASSSGNLNDDDDEDDDDDGSKRFGNNKRWQQPSYNLLMTSSYLQIVPRSKEKFVVILDSQSDPDHKIQVSINSLAFAGMILTKTPEELKMVKGKGPLTILKGVGVPIGKDVAEVADHLLG